MQRFRKGKKGMQAVVLLFVFSLLLASSFISSMVSKAAVKGKKTIRFTSSNKKVTAVNQSGCLTAKKTGSARIKVTVKIRKKGMKVFVKRTTWVKVQVVNAARTERPADQSPSVTPTSSVAPTPDTTIFPTITPAPGGTPEPNHSKSLIVYFFMYRYYKENSRICVRQYRGRYLQD